jgi:hypothetical protein
MKKTSFLWIILDLIFIIIFNTIFFVAGGIKHSVSVWVSYGFIHFAYLMLLLTSRLIRRGKSSAVFGFSLYSISVIYFLIELVTGIIFILLSPENHKIALLIQLCIAGLYGILLIANMIANEHTDNDEEERHYQIAYVKDASSKIKELLDKINDNEARKNVTNIYDAINSSPVKSHIDVMEIEQQILASIGELKDAVSTGNKESIISLASKLLIAVNERNMRLRNFN